MKRKLRYSMSYLLPHPSTFSTITNNTKLPKKSGSLTLSESRLRTFRVDIRRKPKTVLISFRLLTCFSALSATFETFSTRNSETGGQINGIHFHWELIRLRWGRSNFTHSYLFTLYQSCNSPLTNVSFSHNLPSVPYKTNRQRSLLFSSQKLFFQFLFPPLIL